MASSYRHKRWWAFLKAWGRSPGAVGAVIATGATASKTLARAAGVEDAALILEMGAGTGEVTYSILSLAKKHTRLLTIERDPELAAIVRERFQSPSTDFYAWCDVITGDAKDAARFLEERGLPKVNSVVSAIPFTTLSRTAQSEILDIVEEVLDDQGGFSTIVYIHSMCLPSFWMLVRALKSRFPKVSLVGPIWKNAPPAIILKAWKI